MDLNVRRSTTKRSLSVFYGEFKEENATPKPRGSEAPVSTKRAKSVGSAIKPSTSSNKRVLLPGHFATSRVRSIEANRSLDVGFKHEDRLTMEDDEPQLLLPHQMLEIVLGHPQASNDSPDVSSPSSQATSQLLNFTNGITFIDVQELEALKQKVLDLEREKDIKRLKDNSKLMSQIAQLFSSKEDEITKLRKEIQKLTAIVKETQEKYEKEKQENQIFRQELGR
jgi:hypothetical protein